MVIAQNQSRTARYAAQQREARRRKRKSVAVLAAALLGATILYIGCGKTQEKPGETTPAPQDSSVTITISPTVPSDIPGGAGSANLMQAAAFAWQEFIALNWPAVQQTGLPGTRDSADANATFGDPGNTGALVWHTFRAKVEIFPGQGAPHGFNPADTTGLLGYDSLPQYIYANPIPSCTGGPTGPASWINLDETSQIGLDYMYAGILPYDSTATNSRPNLVRFMAKANRSEYNYVARNGYWNHGGNYNTARSNLANAIAGDSLPRQPYINFSPGTIEVKAGWRQLTNGEDTSRFYTTKVRHYEPLGSGFCYREDTWALISLHIIQKTPSAPSFIYATFEQADNILTTDGKPVEDSNGVVINPVSGPSTVPALTYTDSPTNPKVAIVGTSYCDNSGKRVFYKNNARDTSLPTGGNICISHRDNAIPRAIIYVNQAAHGAIAAYAQQKHIATPRWMYYKLVNVQAQPFDISTIDTTNPNGTHAISTFYQANIMVETDYTLQMFSGRFGTGGAPTNYNPNGTPGFKNVHVFPNTGTQVATFNMGGCMGCHGNAQIGGADFSFILEGGAVGAPDPLPATDAADEKLRRKYLDLFTVK